MKNIIKNINIVNIFLAALVMMASGFINVYVSYQSGTFGTIFNAIFYFLEIYGIVMVGIGLSETNTRKFLLGAREVIICLSFSALGNILATIFNLVNSQDVSYSIIYLVLSVVEVVALVLSFISLLKGVFSYKKPIIFFITIGCVLLFNLALLTLNCVFFTPLLGDIINFVYLCGETLGISLFSISFLYCGYIFSK